MGAQFREHGQRNKKIIILSVVSDDLVPYCLRHTYCTDLEAAGVPINIAARLMGHSNILLTSKIYTHSSETALDNAASAINAYCQKATPDNEIGDTRSDTSESENSSNIQYSS